MTTKEKILGKALECFNRDGTDAVTVRSIATELGMSHGNLCYHFPTTDDIIKALYFQLVEEMNAQIASNTVDEGNPDASGKGVKIDIKFLAKMTKASFESLYKYRFLLLDFVHIMRRMPEIKTHYQALTKMRHLQFQFLISALEKNRYVKPQRIDNQYDTWIQSAILFGDFWLSNAEIIYEGAEENKVETYWRMFMRMSAPYLTAEGLRELDAVLKEPLI
jgi:AcrR family transcriptional regulator